MTDETKAEKYPRPLYEQEAIAAGNRRLAELKAHPSYEAVMAANPHREPSQAELDEHAEAAAFGKLPRAAKIAHMVDALLVEAKNQVKHNAPVSPSIVQQLEAIAKLLT
jgi:hypothetical protein